MVTNPPTADIKTYKYSIAIKTIPSPKILLGLGLISSRIPLISSRNGGTLTLFKVICKKSGNKVFLPTKIEDICFNTCIIAKSLTL